MPDDHKAGRRKRAAKFCDHGVRKRFALRTRYGIKKDERGIFVEARERISGWERATKPFADGRASAFRQFKITVNGMSMTIDFGDTSVKQA